MSAYRLRQIMEGAAADLGCPMKDLTVLSAQRDPFRLDTPGKHRDGEWLAVTAQELGLGDRKIHLRGLHYMMIGRPKPDGKPYTNTDEDWTWLSEDAGKSARWLGYLPFEQIIDQRNTPPIIRRFREPAPSGHILVGLEADIPDVDQLAPTVAVTDFRGVQPYKIVFFGEKASLADVLGPIADAFQADLYLPTGEISDTMLHQMASVGADDGRPMVVLCFSDCDPAGWQMPISIARKLQGFKALEFDCLDFEVRRVGLSPDQVRAYGLPSTPLKEKESRAGRWRESMGVEQTEIDALASLRPELLRRLARDAIEPYFDATLQRRVDEARKAWVAEAQSVIDRTIDEDRLEALRVEAAEKLAAMREQIAELNSQLRLDTDDFDLPDLVIPDAELPDRDDGLPLLDSRWSFGEQCRRLIDSKAYDE